MRILLISAASLAALSAAPATAQSYNPNYSGSYGDGYARRSVPTPYQVRSMIDAAQRRGEISDDQASNLREQADELVRLDRRAQRDDDDGDVRHDLTRRTYALLRDLRQARVDPSSDYAYRGRSTDYPPAYGSTPQGGYDDARRTPGDDDDQPYAAAPDDSYRSAPRTNDPYGTTRSYDPGRAAPENDDSYRAPSRNEDADRSTPANEPYGTAPTPNDDQRYDDPNGQDDTMTPPDDGIYRPRNN